MNINLNTPVSSLGYGQVGKYILYELSKQNNVSLFPIGQIDSEEKFYPSIKASLENAQLFDKHAPSVRIFHQFSLAEQFGSPKIGFPFFELDTFTTREKHHLESCDFIFVTSQWAKNIVLDQTSLQENQVFIVPLGVDTDIFYPQEKKAEEKTVFLNIGKTEIRKGHEVLVTAFDKAFTDENVELWMMWQNPFLSPEDQESWNKYYIDMLGNKVKFIPRVKSHEEVAHIINQADVGVFPYFAEAWNLDLLEMMACGKQVIATNYSGPTEYLNNDNSFLLDTTDLTSAFDGVWFKGEGNWAQYDEDQLIEHLRCVHNNKQINKAGIETAKKFTWSNTAKVLQEHLKTL